MAEIFPERILWSHYNALAHDKSYQGVRLTYAISEWIELGSAGSLNRRHRSDGGEDGLIRGYARLVRRSGAGQSAVGQGDRVASRCG